MQPNGNVIVIEAEPINEYLTCGQPKVLRDHVIHSLVDLPIIDHPTRIYVRLPRYRCTNKRCLQKTFHTGLACALDNSKTTNRVTHWILQRLSLSRCSRRDLQRQALHLVVPDPRRQHPTHNQCTLKPEEPLNGGISKDFSWHFTPNRFQTGRLGRFGVKCRLFGGERGCRAHQSQPSHGCENVPLHTGPRPNPRRTNQCTLKPEEPTLAAS
ncbi:hypothetical protein FRC0263_00156 [Corynebacterium diphtheriae]|nr:hypothetical protein FRC0263_00156 [Corynebacterium diphtheriae]CAB0936176.1 hypothetical protein FRC0474_00153 [Corynebacterium diphtheriae]